MNSNNAAAIENIFADNWDELFELNQRLDLDALLESELLAATRHSSETVSNLYSISGSISIVASTLLIVHILRSYDGLTTTYHRLIFGLSIADLFSSFPLTLGTVMIPKEMNYIMPHAVGSMTTCNIQGALIDIGMGGAAMYNCCICLYFYAIIKCNKKDKYIREKLERWFHGVSILHPLIFAILAYFQKLYFFDAYDGAYCFSGGFSARSTPQCIGYDKGEIPEGFSIPCNGPEFDFTALSILSQVITTLWSFTLVVFPPGVCITTMLIMYRSVSKIEQKMQNYGVNTLRITQDDIKGSNKEDDTSTDNRRYSVIGRIKTVLINIISCCCCCCYSSILHHQCRRPPKQRLNRLKSSKREILYRGTGFVMAWALVFIPMIIGITFDMVSSPQQTLYKAGHIIVAITTPLQGLYNFLAFMAPKVRATIQSRARKNERSNWCEAFYTAYTSRGNKDRSKTSTRGLEVVTSSSNKARYGGSGYTATVVSSNKKTLFQSSSCNSSNYITEQNGTNQCNDDDSNSNEHSKTNTANSNQQQVKIFQDEQQKATTINSINAGDTEESLSIDSLI
mmetsp:Transcript_2387/g.2888  ORF Transcript_2387/g.2888 Transcript_2387/m.2888 type:complete len:567 (+) Transcript_2387:45-1745(+)